MRDVVFIGHATPEDNEFTLWLQAKLRNEGYNCECDLSFLLGGESDYWNNIQEMLTEKAKKYILVLSKDTFNKSGVKDEWEHCRSLEKELNLTDFIIPVKIDDVSFNVRIGLNRRNIIPFQQWGVGLKKLLRKLEADNVPKNHSNSLSIKDWYDNVYTTYSGIDYKSPEIFFSNWLAIQALPKIFYLYKFHNEDQAKKLLVHNTIYPIIRHGNYLATFSKEINTSLPNLDFDITPREKISIDTEKAFSFFESDDFPQYQDVKNLVMRLLKDALEKQFKSLGLLSYELANENKCYYFQRINEEKTKGIFVLNGKNKNIGVTGNYKGIYWHFAISFLPLLYPTLCYSLRTHIIFTENGSTPVADKRKQHSFRRDKGRLMFNKEWRDQVLAFTALLKTSTEKDYFDLRMNEHENIQVLTTPIKFNSKFGYIEPKDENRIKPADDFFEDEEYYDDLEKDYLDGI